MSFVAQGTYCGVLPHACKSLVRVTAMTGLQYTQSAAIALREWQVAHSTYHHGLFALIMKQEAAQPMYGQQAELL